MTPRFRRIVLAVAIVPMVLLIGLRSAWAAYACRMDGQVRLACCCPDEANETDRERAPSDEPTRISASCCCDVTVGETGDAPQARETERGHTDDVAFALITTTMADSAAISTSPRTRVHRFARPPPRSIPTYLANRTILR